MKYGFILLITLPVISSAQEITVDFENENLSDWYQNANEHWTITNEESAEGLYSLAHNFDNGNSCTDWIAFFHPPLIFNETEVSWLFSVKYNFNPSANNNWAVILSDGFLPDAEEFTDKAMIIGVNYRGNDDYIKIWKQEDGDISEVLNTGINWEESNLSSKWISFQIKLNVSVNIDMEIDTANNEFVHIGETDNNFLNQCNIFILNYKYTSTYDQGLFIDNIRIRGTFSDDIVSPEIKTAQVTGPGTVDIEFTEFVLVKEGPGFCINGIGCSQTYKRFGRHFQLKFLRELTPAYSYNLQLPDISDMYGNGVDEEDRQVLLYYPSVYDILINEVMPDPSPPVLLPEAEYIELYNITDKIIPINNWNLTVNTKQIRLPEYTIREDEYLILADKEFSESFDENIHVMGVDNFPALNNYGASVLLQDFSGKLIHSVTYSSDWYSSPETGEGGRSLELVNQYDPCRTFGNWQESNDYRGGTPGTVNSVRSIRIFNSVPELWRAAVTDTGSLMLYFSEALDSISTASFNYYHVDHGIGHPFMIVPSWPLVNAVELFFDKAFSLSVEYTVQLTSDLTDCSGINISGNTYLNFCIPQPADSGDIVINEIMFEPAYDLREYVELYNNAETTIDLRNYMIIAGEMNDEAGIITSEYFPVVPDEYIVISEGYSGIDNDGSFNDANRIIVMQDMPALVNMGTSIYLLDKDTNLIDGVYYSPEFHHELLADTKGVSLERISPDESGFLPDNWISASSDAGYQTPGEENSQYGEIIRRARVGISPETITPDGDGYEDELSICYTMDNPGYMARIMVFDVQGRLIIEIINGNILGTEGCFKFDGKSSSGERLPTGYYILLFDAYNEEGNRHTIKKAFVIASK
ncbi:MAG: lamin tail domain-containing protein [Bacteroidales bacterium]|nr:lamin tail domain-containing protein [Bacteroidales bacterium]